MQINFTFFLQILNFGITYWFLNKFMFKPVLAFIQKKNNLQDKVNLKIKKTENNIYDLEKQKNEELIYFKKLSKDKYIVETDSPKDIPGQVKYTVNKQEILSLTNKAKDLLVKRVPHVD